MKRTTGIVLGLALAVGAGGTWTVAALAEDMDRTRAVEMDQTRDQDREMIFGSQLMSEQERATYRKQLMAAKSEEERNQIRAQHHERMLARAKEQGVILPEEPAMQGGKGMGMGTGMGGGMGGGHMGGK